MCCLVTILVLIGPRAGIIIWWLLDMARWQSAFDMLIIPLLGFIFLPWTTLAYVLVFSGGLTGFDWALLVLGFLFDIGAYGGGYGNRGRLRR
jgi:hypothetical protein